MKLKKYISMLLCILMIISNITIVNAANSGTFTGISNTQQILTNIKFTDIASMPSTYWAKAAINKMAALNVIQGYGNRTFGPSNSVTNAEALALIYRAIGKEAAAEQAGQAIEKQRLNSPNKNNALSVWADGYLSLAKTDGIITQTQFDQAIGNAPVFGTLEFNPNSTAKRQDVAQWIAIVFKMKPIYNETAVFNYSDWKQIDQDKVPYVEAILENNIMNGDNGRFYPNSVLSRAEMAQILANMKDFIYKAHNLNESSGYIEDITAEAGNLPGTNSTTRTILIRGTDGTSQKINLTVGDGSKTVEIGTHTPIDSQNEVIVSKNGVLGNSRLLSKDDEVQFVYDNNNAVEFIEAKTGSKDPIVTYDTINSVNVTTNTINFTDPSGNVQNLPVSLDAVILIQNEVQTLNDIVVGSRAYFTINHNIVTKIEVSDPKTVGDLSDAGSENSGVRGVVQDINPNLNYITLYNVYGKKKLSLTTTYNFTPNTQINKNGQKTDAKSIEVGDTAYLKFASDDSIELINVESNYISKFGMLLLNGNNNLTIKYDDGNTQKLFLDQNALVVKNGDIVPVNSLIAGDRLKITLNQNDSYTKIEGIVVEDDQHLITNIYKGNIYELDSGNIELTGTKVLSKGKWVDEADRGLAAFDLGDSLKIYLNNKNLALSDAQKLIQNKTAYLAAYKDLSGDEKVVIISANDGYEMTYNDKIVNKSGTSKDFEMATTVDNVGLADGTIITRYGRLTTGSNLNVNDPVYVVALKNPTTDNIIASVVQVEEKPSIDGIDIYRGRISAVNQGENFMVDSFSLLNGTDWSFVNTPKTFDISNDTRILSAQGLINNRDFNGYAGSGYIGKIVYIAAKGTLAMNVSDADYGIYNIKGDLYDISLPTTSSGTATIKMRNAVILNITTGNWNSIGDSTIDVPANTIIVKNKEAADPSELTAGDKVRIIKKDNTATGESFIILVEG